jgi:hypothetical protein
VPTFPKVPHLIKSKTVEILLSLNLNMPLDISLSVPVGHCYYGTFLTLLEQCMTASPATSENNNE